MRKWTKGERIRDPLTAVEIILSGGTLFHNHKAQNASWMRGWPLHAIEIATSRGELHRAEPIKEPAA
jgi:hypothetical protein